MPPRRRDRRPSWCWALVAAALAAGAAPARAAQVPDAPTVAKVRALPVQFDGRAMPFDTEARDTVRTVTGRRSWPGLDPVAMALGWAMDPQGWVEEPIVRIDGVGGGARRAALGQALRQLPRAWSRTARCAPRSTARGSVEDAGEKPTPIEKNLLEARGSAAGARRLLRTAARSGRMPAADPDAAWEIAAERASAAALDAVLEARVRPTAPSFYPSPDAIASRAPLQRACVRRARLDGCSLPAAVAAGPSRS